VGYQLAEIEMEKLDRIQINPKICLGQPVVRGTRITVSVILKLLANGRSIEDVIELYPELEAADIQEAMKYAAWVVSDQLLETQVL
jgi:uncharacterized protein (DUF433 family)